MASSLPPIRQFQRPELPSALFEGHRPPEELFIQGSDRALGLLEQLPSRGLAVVGTRTPQPRSLQLVRSEFRKLQGYPLVILSGLARGIDAEAHRSALAARLPTIAVVANGLDMAYPACNL